MTRANRDHPLIGQAFHTQQDNLVTEWQGKVVADCGGGHFLVQLYEWFSGGATTRHVLTLAEFAAKHENGVPRFRFFDSMEQANAYMDMTATARDEMIADEQRGSVS